MRTADLSFFIGVEFRNGYT